MHSFIRQELSKLTELLSLIHQDDSLLANITSISHRCAHSLLSGNKLLFAGNGGSAADAQHLADIVAGDSLVNTANERGIFTDKLHKIKKAIQSTLTYTSI